MDRAGMYHTGISKGAHHKGPGTAGNKSLISFRAGHGVCGYNGYIPSSESIPIPTKEGPASRAADNTNKERGQTGWEMPQEVSSLSTYQASISNSSIATRRPVTAPISYGGPPRGPASPPNEDSVIMQSQDDLAINLPNAKFLGTSTYAVGYRHPTDNARLYKDDLAPLPRSALRKRPAFMAGSTYSGTIDNSMELLNGQGWMEEKHRKLLGKDQTKFGTKWREVVYQRKPSNTFYHTDYGVFGEGLANKLPATGFGFSQAASTLDLFKGTNKSYARVPGYTGFLPESGANAHATMQATDHTATDQKNCRLFTLHQQKLHIPGTSIFQARDAANLIDGPKGRVGTATHFNNAYVSDPANLVSLAHKRTQEKYYGSVNGTASFFLPGTMSISENGVKNAEAFYRLMRPYEGLPRVFQPSLTAESGYKFGCYREAN
mmetsp:Transcript_73488/g.119272  ORF Transcript_73488/g.119272 Transcript_73488/m.119272 type:complete len:434 (+) Transcript_73488:93-1394(+)